MQSKPCPSLLFWVSYEGFFFFGILSPNTYSMIFPPKAYSDLQKTPRLKNKKTTKKVKVYVNVITKYDICMVLIILNLYKWNGQHHKPITLSKLLLRYANGTVLFHFTWFSKAPWTHFLWNYILSQVIKSSLVFSGCLFVCFTTSFSSIENRVSSLDPQKNIFIKPLAHSPVLRIIYEEGSNGDSSKAEW